MRWRKVRYIAYADIWQDERNEKMRKAGRISLAGPKNRHRPIYRGDAKSRVVDGLKDILRNWKYSPFQHEAACRHGLRSSLCLKGYAWSRADFEAELLVGEALRLLGAKRPSYAQGQPEYTVPRENCRWCALPMPENMNEGRKSNFFCSAVCANSALLHRNLTMMEDDNRTFHAARRLVRRDGFATVLCAHCGTPFKPPNSGHPAKYCSMKCTGLARRLPARVCAGCGKTFHSDNRNRLFCSKSCYTKAGNTLLLEKVCEWCEREFTTKSPKAVFCCTACRAQQRFFSRHETKRISVPVFDYMFRPPKTPRPEPITAQQIDWLFMERGLRITAEVRIGA